MIYLEIIRVQSAEIHSEPLKNTLWALVQKELDGLESSESHIFFRIEPAGEAMVMIRRDVESFDVRGSRVARVLVSELNKYGLVNYSVWAEGK